METFHRILRLAWRKLLSAHSIILVLYATGGTQAYSTSDCDGHSHDSAVYYTAFRIQEKGLTIRKKAGLPTSSIHRLRQFGNRAGVVLAVWIHSLACTIRAVTPSLSESL